MAKSRFARRHALGLAGSVLVASALIGCGTVTGAGGKVHGCVDRIAPTSRFNKARSASRARGVRLSGRSSDRGCGAGGRGRDTYHGPGRRRG